MKDSKAPLSEVVYALAGLLVVAIIVAVLVLIAKPIVRSRQEARIARQEEEVCRVKTFLMEASADSTLNAIQLKGNLTEEKTDGKKSKGTPILMVIEISLKKYNQGEVSGYYRNTSQAEESTIELSGECNLTTGNIVLVSKKLAERFELQLNDSADALDGYWMKYKSTRQLRKKPENFQQRMVCSLTNNQ